MAYLVHHTLNRNGTYTGGKRNPLPFDENIITDKSQHKTKSETSKATLFPFKTNGRKCELECPIHGIINSCELKAHIWVGYPPIFYPPKIHNDLCWKNMLVNLKDE